MNGDPVWLKGSMREYGAEYLWLESESCDFWDVVNKVPQAYQDRYVVVTASDGPFMRRSDNLPDAWQVFRQVFATGPVRGPADLPPYDMDDEWWMFDRALNPNELQLENFIDLGNFSFMNAASWQHRRPEDVGRQLLLDRLVEQLNSIRPVLVISDRQPALVLIDEDHSDAVELDDAIRAVRPSSEQRN